jgi:hypothetical protein
MFIGHISSVSVHFLKFGVRMAARLGFGHYKIGHRTVPHKSANATENPLSTPNIEEYGSS